MNPSVLSHNLNNSYSMNVAGTQENSAQTKLELELVLHQCLPGREEISIPTPCSRMAASLDDECVGSEHHNALVARNLETWTGEFSRVSVTSLVTNCNCLQQGPDWHGIDRAK